MKEIIWVGDSLDNLKSFPEDVKSAMGYALNKVQVGVSLQNS